ncbi:Citrate transporter [Listeria grayi]|uniref:2-hydroxycarboxylate transporter family protein n=1 Tax=Listeria grayi TaxID=1641 RepID=UPI000F7054F6|nr:2-hydroxycarboxylate transporter family protein [Listeria grayi]VEI31301.1 Citrate transporter [Listeria grayi]
MSNSESNVTSVPVATKKSFWSIKISGISLPFYLIMLAILVVVISLGKLPNNILGAIAVLVLLGNLFHFIGTKIPIVRTYLGGGAVFCIFASATIATFGILPSSAVETTKSFVNNMGFLDFYIAALITGSILGMNRQLLIKASIRFIPVALLSMAISLLMVGLVGALIGNGFGNSILYVSLPVMAGGIGAGVVPLSGIYAHALAQPAAHIISRLIPASAMGNVLAIIGAALVSKFGESSKANGHGTLMDGDFSAEKPKEIKLDITKMGVGLLVSLSFFMLGSIGNYFVPKIHSYAFMIIIVVICKVANLIPAYYEESAIMFNNLIVKNLTAAVLAGIGIALIDLNVLAQSLTWQFMLLCLTSIITISLSAGLIGKLFGLYPVEASITAGFCNNSMGGTGNVAVLSASNRMGLIAFAQMGNRMGGAIILIISGFLIQLLS